MPHNEKGTKVRYTRKQFRDTYFVEIFKIYLKEGGGKIIKYRVINQRENTVKNEGGDKVI